jgi:hypothetical protein
MRVILGCFLSSIAFGQYFAMTTEIAGDTMTVKLSNPGRSSEEWFAHAFSGEQRTEIVRMLPDGRLIQRRTNCRKIWRDSQGRTRTERELDPELQLTAYGAFVLTEIHDPVKGVFYILDDQNRIAHRLVLSESLVRTTVPGTGRKVRMGCSLQNAMQDPRTAPLCVERNFLEQNIEGVTASGWRRYDPVPDADNGRRVIVTDEEWYSDEMAMTVLRRHSDPREGETIMRWIHMSREEPAITMFAPSEDYRVVDEKDAFTLTLKRRY